MTEIGNLIDQMPEAERKQISEDFSTWYNDAIKLYNKDFDIVDGESTMRSDMSKDQVILFFKNAIMWWQKQKPILESNGKMTAMQILKTLVCLGQIKALTDRYTKTGLSIKKLNLRDELST